MSVFIDPTARVPEVSSSGVSKAPTATRLVPTDLQEDQRHKEVKARLGAQLAQLDAGDQDNAAQQAGREARHAQLPPDCEWALTLRVRASDAEREADA